MRYSLISPYREYMPTEARYMGSPEVLDGEQISCVDVSDDLLHTMGLSNDCQLYALPMTEGGRSLVLTCIPYELWGSLCRITIHMADHPGSLAEAAKIVAGEGANMLASWAAATTSAGEGCWTAIVSFAELEKENDEKTTAAVREIEARIRKSFTTLDKSSVLPQFKMRDGGPLLESVTVERLRVLPALRKSEGINDARAFEGTITDYQIAFRSFRKESGNLYTSFIEPYVRHNGLPAHFLVSPDPREGYFCLSPIRSYEFFQLVVEYAVFSRESKFEGYFTIILEALEKLGLNLYSAKNFLIKKGMEKGDTDDYERPVERTRQEFIVDLERHAKSYDDLSKLQMEIQTALRMVLAAKAKEHDDAVEGPSVQLQDVDRFEPCCFLSTNAHTEDQCEQVIKLIRSLRSLRLKPVSVDIVMSSDRFIFSEAVQLLNASCMVVSLHFPVKENTLCPPTRKSKRECCPSDWVLFEEAYGLARSRGVFRILQPQVRAPRYSFGQRTFAVDPTDKDGFNRRVEELLENINRYKQTDDFRRALAESNRFAATVPHALLDRNVEQAYAHFIKELRARRLQKTQRRGRASNGGQ